MALFPFFMNIEGRRGLILGGGRYALEKIERLIPFGPHLEVAAEEFCPEIEALFFRYPQQISRVVIQDLTYSCYCMNRLSLVDKLCESDGLSGNEKLSAKGPLAFVIAAVEEREENHKISKLCQQQGIPVNVVDDPAWCTFVFPSLITQGSLTIGISTAGTSPTAAAWLRHRIQEQIPDRMDEILEWLCQLRPHIRRALPEERQRREFHRHLIALCMGQNRPLTETEWQMILEEYQTAEPGA